MLAADPGTNGAIACLILFALVMIECFGPEWLARPFRDLIWGDDHSDDDDFKELFP